MKAKQVNHMGMRITRRLYLNLAVAISTILSALILFGCWPLFDMLARALGEAVYAIRMQLFLMKGWLFLMDLFALGAFGGMLYFFEKPDQKYYNVLFWTEFGILLVGAFFSYWMLPLLRLLGG